MHNIRSFDHARQRYGRHLYFLSRGFELNFEQNCITISRVYPVAINRYLGGCLSTRHARDLHFHASASGILMSSSRARLHNPALSVTH